MNVAAYQAPLLSAGSMEALDLIRGRVVECESQGVTILCCPEAILGGLADDSDDPARFAIAADSGRLGEILAPLASDTVTTIVGFTELGAGERLYNSAAVFHRGSVIGIYRKRHPAIRRSVYAAGEAFPVFTVSGLTFGIVICNDSNFAEPASRMAAQGATALFVASNTGLPPAKASAALVTASRQADIALATANRLWVIRADVAGRTNELVSFGASGVVDPSGIVTREARPLVEELIVAELS